LHGFLGGKRGKRGARKKLVVGAPPGLLAVHTSNHHDGGGAAHLMSSWKAELGVRALHMPPEEHGRRPLSYTCQPPPQ